MHYLYFTILRKGTKKVIPSASVLI